MRTWTETRREGTKVGEIDFEGYNWAKWHGNYAVTNPAEKAREEAEKSKALFREIEAAHKDGKLVIAWSTGDFGHEVLDIGMYDGWPFWEPTPALFCSGTLGGEWHHYNSIRRCEIRERKQPEQKESN